MNKEKFLEKLRKKLDILNQDEVNDIIDEYGGYIDEKVKKGKTEEEAIKEFGDFDELVKEILSAYKINEDYEEKKSDWFSNFFESVGNAIDHIVRNLSNKSGSEIAKFVIEIIFLLLIISLFRIPVVLIENLGEGIFSLLISPFDYIFISIWRFVIEICYIALAVIFFVKICKERYLGDEVVIVKEKEKTKPKKTVKKNNEIKKEKVIEVKPEKSKESSFHFLGVLSSIVMWFIKAMLIVLMFPLCCAVIGLMIICTMGITLLCSGVPYFGVVLCIFAVLAFFLFLLDILIHFIASKKNHPMKLFVSLIICFALLSVGITITAFEFADSTFIDALPERYTAKTVTKKITLDDIKKSNRHLEYWNITFEEDNSKKNNIELSVTYYPDYMDFEDFNITSYPRLKRGETYRISDVLDSIKDDFKDRTIYNYSLLFTPEIKITASSDMIQKIKTAFWGREEKRLYDEIEGLEEKLDRADEQINYWKEKYENLSERDV